jgi:hypothetical protein
VAGPRAGSGDDQIRAHLRGQRQRSVDRAGLLRVRERHGGEVRVGIRLRGNGIRACEAGLLECLLDDLVTHAMQRGVHHPQPPRAVRGHQRGHRG